MRQLLLYEKCDMQIPWGIRTLCLKTSYVDIKRIISHDENRILKKGLGNEELILILNSLKLSQDFSVEKLVSLERVHKAADQSDSIFSVPVLK